MQVFGEIMFRNLIAFLLVGFGGLGLQAQTVRLDRFDQNSGPDIYFKTFSITQDSKIQITGEMSLFSAEVPTSFIGSAWIYEPLTGNVIWELSNQEFESNGTSVDINLTLPIKKGNYELYFSTFPSLNRISGKGGKWNRLFNGTNAIVWGLTDLWDDIKKESRRWFIQVKSDNLVKGSDNVERNFSNEFISFKKAKNDQSYRKTFEVNKSVKMRVIAQGEGVNYGMVDYGMIRNVDTRQVVWEMEYDRTFNAGGAEKNRKIDEAIELKPGRYEAIYKTDDSHCYDNWNEEPPYDPQFWGMVVLAIDKNSLDNLKFTEIESLPAIVDINRVGDSKVIKKYFKILKTCRVNVYAVGEGTIRQMADYGWIEDVENNERIWQMEYDETENAGGAEKNRMEDVVLTLQPGVYMAYYVTDDSHSYNDWNSSSPLNPEDWGMKIRLLEKGKISDYAEMISKYVSPNVLVDLTGIGDDAQESEDFEIDKPTRVRIISIGEGDSGEMYDYGWIENNETGEVVWEMTYRKTKHAGGAQKNRKVDQVITLDEGSYTVFYKTDGSHSFGNWNSTPPDDQSGWGIKILKNDRN